MTQIIAVANQKGGVGKTTTAVNLACGLALAGCHVLLVDFDPQANATSCLGQQSDSAPPQNHYLLSSEAGFHPIATRFERLSLVPCSPSLQATGKILAAAPDRDFRLRRALSDKVTSYDFVLIDCPPSFSTFTTNAMIAADSVIVPLQCEYLAMEGLAQMLGVVRSVKRGPNPSLEIYGILLTMFDALIEINREVAHEVHSHFGKQVFDSIIVRDEALAESASHGLSIFEYQPRSRAAFSYAKLTREVLGDSRKETGPGV